MNGQCKRLIALLSAAALCLPLASCKGGESTAETSAKSTDWRDKIEYEGSFFVCEDTKLLYALDTGSVTLWDNAGDGAVLQVLKYDTAEPDAIERLEKDDVNGDGCADLRVIYSESETRSSYNLWLWNNELRQFSDCPLFRTLQNPVINGDGTVSCTVDKGIFGVIDRVYRFTDKLALELVSNTVTDEFQTAANIAVALCGADGAGTLFGGVATVDDVSCTPFAATLGGETVAYIAVSPDADWYVDAGCIGLYRAVRELDGTYALGEYTGEAQIAEELAIVLAGKDTGITIPEVLRGSMDIYPAHRYKICVDGEYLCSLVCDETGQWFFSTDNMTFTRISPAKGGELEDTVPFAFT